MKKKLSNPYIITLLILFSYSICNAQNFSESGLNFGAEIGFSRLLGEIPGDFSGLINEFDNKTGFSGAFEISKYLSSRWEAGGNLELSNLNGNTYNPAFSAEGIQPSIPAEIIDPVEYKNKLWGFNLFFRYFFKPVDSGSKVIPFIKAGGGFIKYYSKFKYIDASENDLIFGKGTEGYTKLSTPQFFFGTGFKTPLNQQLSIITSIDFNFVNYDFLDVMHNYKPDGSRQEVIGLYTAFRIGVFYNAFKMNNNQSTKRTGSSSNESSLPFAR